MDAHDPQETQQQESCATTDRRGNKSTKQGGNAPGKMCFSLSGTQTYHTQQRIAAGTNQRNREETPQEKCVFRYQVPKHITLNDVIMVTRIIGIRTTRINGIRNVLTKN